MSDSNKPPKPSFAQRLMHDSVFLVSFLAPVVTLVMFLYNRAGYDVSYRANSASARDWKIGLGLFGTSAVVCVPLFINRMSAWNRMVSCPALVGERSASWQGLTIDLSYELDGTRHLGKTVVRPSSLLAAKRKNSIVNAWVDPKHPTNPRVVLDRFVRP